MKFSWMNGAEDLRKTLAGLSLTDLPLAEDQHEPRGSRDGRVLVPEFSGERGNLTLLQLSPEGQLVSREQWTPEASDSRQEALRNYVAWVAAAEIEKVLGLYADNAQVMDPAGSRPKAGEELAKFYEQSRGRLSDGNVLFAMDTSPTQAVVAFDMQLAMGPQTYRLRPVDLMTFDEAGKITEMQAFWSMANMPAC